METDVVTNHSERREETETAPLEVLYRHRFSDEDRRAKDKIWRILCTHFFSRYVPHDATVLDIGAGYCEFINYIAAKRRIAVDANPDVTRFASPGVEAFCANVANMDFLADESVDVAFSSNFFEHLPTKRALTQLTLEIRRILRPGGRLLVMGPNIACIPGKYWDYYDHHLPLTDKSVEELLHTSGYQIERSIARFLPYTFKSRLPKWSWLVRAYLMLGKLTFPIFGEQFFLVARKDEHRS